MSRRSVRVTGHVGNADAVKQTRGHRKLWDSSLYDEAHIICVLMDDDIAGGG